MRTSNENLIKALVIDELLAKSPSNSILGSEVMFGSRRRFVDLLLLGDDIEVFEIKSDVDDLRNLGDQISYYMQVFDRVNLVVSEMHFKKASKMLPDSCGIMVIEEPESIKIFREAKKLLNQNKFEVLSSITASYLKEFFALKGNLSAFEIRRSLENISLKSCKSVYKEYLKGKLIEKNNIFLSERGEYTLDEDIALLSFQSRQVY